MSILQLSPSEKVQNSYENYQEEVLDDSDYKIFDANYNNLIKYDDKYILVIDSKPFSLNNYEETIQDLMALNFIMKSEYSDFNYSDVMKKNGKSYFQVSEDTYNKINSLKNIKGIYTYIAQKADTKEAWSAVNIFSDLLDEDYEDGSLQSIINVQLKDNKPEKEKFVLDEKAVYSSKSDDVNEKNKNLQLTIDEDMQNKVREVLEDDKYDNLKNIGVLIMESNSGKIRVMSQKDETEANINLAMQQIGYEPGSIYKIITLSAGLDLGLVNVSDKYLCSGRICKNAHGNISIEDAFEKSCNDVFAQIGNKVGYDKLMEYSEKQGLFTRVLGFEGENKNESAGIKPKEEAGINNISIGQCMNVTPIQMIGAVNTIVNKGVYVKPYILQAILDKDNVPIKEFSSEGKKIYSETTAKIVKNSMKQVVLKGTGKKAYIRGLDIGGKTGSSTGNNTTHGWFSGYFKIGTKEYTMIVFTPYIDGLKEDNNEDAGGGDTAAPIFKDIVNKLNK